MATRRRHTRLPILTRTLARFASVEIHGDWDAFDRGLSRNLRGDVRRSLRRLQDVGEVRFEHLDGLEQLDHLLTEVFRVESSGWKGARGTAIASRPETERFYREVCAWAAESGNLRVTVLRLAGRAIAFELGIEEHGVHYTLKAGFDPAQRAFSPGKLLIHHILERSFSIGLHATRWPALRGTSWRGPTRSATSRSSRPSRPLRWGSSTGPPSGMAARSPNGPSRRSRLGGYTPLAVVPANQLPGTPALEDRGEGDGDRPRNARRETDRLKPLLVLCEAILERLGSPPEPVLEDSLVERFAGSVRLQDETHREAIPGWGAASLVARLDAGKSKAVPGGDTLPVHIQKPEAKPAASRRVTGEFAMERRLGCEPRAVRPSCRME